MDKKNKYIKPHMEYWCANELDKIEAQMSGGGFFAPVEILSVSYNVVVKLFCNSNG